jgi:hypothetical protein
VESMAVGVDVAATASAVVAKAKRADDWSMSGFLLGSPTIVACPSEEWKHASDRLGAVRNGFLVGGATGQLDGTR